jgi:iron complex transport system substrate-binding protein
MHRLPTMTSVFTVCAALLVTLVSAAAQPVPPQRIVTLIPSLTETVCAIGACSRLVGTDRYSNWPESVLALPKLGGMDDARIERIVALKPDLVLASPSTRAVERLRALGLRVLTFEVENQSQMRTVLLKVADVVGQPGQGERVWADIRQQIAAAAARVPSSQRGRSVYFELGGGAYAAGPNSFIGETLTALGMRNIVPAEFGVFPKMNPEFTVRAQPALIITSESQLQAMYDRPGWQRVLALRKDRVCVFDAAAGDVLVRPGPRLGEAARWLAACLEKTAP